MSFTAKELAWYKEKATRSNTYTNQDCDRALAMIERLEAAERLAETWHHEKCGYHKEEACDCDDSYLKVAWLKSKGELR